MWDAGPSGVNLFIIHAAGGGATFLKPTIIVHGGAGSGRYGSGDPRHAGLVGAVEAGLAALRKGSAVDGAMAAVECMEDSGLFNCGKGAYLTAGGKMELDAAVMSGEGLAGAGVGSVTSTHNPVALARWVMENTRHVLLVGGPTRDYARLAGLEVEELTPTKPVAARFEAMKREAKFAGDVRIVDRFSAKDTVGAVALGSDGVPASAVSTGGMWMKLPGRVGDSAILGAGLFADSNLGASCATGTGEEIIRVGLCMKACEFMEADDAKRAAARAIEHITKVRGRGTAGIITVDLKGRVGAAFNTEAMGRAWFDHEKGRVVATVGPDS